MKELAAQSALVDAARNEGGHAFKMNNRFVKGIPDLSIQLPNYQHVYLEVKMGRTNTLSVHQAKFMREYWGAGGACGWLRIQPEKSGPPGNFALYVEARDNIGLNPFLCSFRKLRGGAWPIQDIVQYITEGRKNG